MKPGDFKDLRIGQKIYFDEVEHTITGLKYNNRNQRFLVGTDRMDEYTDWERNAHEFTLSPPFKAKTFYLWAIQRSPDSCLYTPGRYMDEDLKDTQGHQQFGPEGMIAVHKAFKLPEQVSITVPVDPQIFK